MDKKRAVQTLQSLVERIAYLSGQKRFSEEFKKWQQDTRAALKWIFKEDPDYVKEFDDIDYTLRSFSSATPISDFQNAYVHGLQSARAMLQARIGEIEQFWPDESESTTSPPDAKAPPKSPDVVFVIHGRQKLDEFHAFLRAIGLHPLEWSKARKLTGKPTPYTWEIVDTAITNAGAIVALLTPDDEAQLRKELWTPSENALEKELLPQARQNVLFEAGVAYGRAPQRTVLIRIGSHRPMSDLAGHHILVLNNSPESRQAVADALNAAGCPVDVSSSDWFKAGNFE